MLRPRKKISLLNIYNHKKKKKKILMREKIPFGIVYPFAKVNFVGIVWWGNDANNK